MPVYVKSNWVAAQTVDAARLNNLETQYDDLAVDGLFSRPSFFGYREKKVSLAIGTPTAGVLTVDFNAGNVFEFTVNAIWSLATLNVPAAGYIGSFDLIAVGNGSSFAVTWPASIKWPGTATAPVLTITSGKRDFIHLKYDVTAAQWYGFVMGQNL